LAAARNGVAASGDFEYELIARVLGWESTPTAPQAKTFLGCHMA
jgi:hypothetical protein